MIREILRSVPVHSKRSLDWNRYPFRPFVDNYPGLPTDFWGDGYPEGVETTESKVELVTKESRFKTEGIPRKLYVYEIITQRTVTYINRPMKKKRSPLFFLPLS